MSVQDADGDVPNLTNKQTTGVGEGRRKNTLDIVSHESVDRGEAMVTTPPTRHQHQLRIRPARA